MVTWTSVAPERFALQSGAEILRSYWSSPEVEWQFCSNCGSSLFYRATHTPGQVYVAAASLDGLDRLPDSHVSFEEHLPWFHPGLALPHFQGKGKQLFPSPGQVGLRAVERGDLPHFYLHQLDLDAQNLVGLPSRDWEGFLEHWQTRIFGDSTALKQTVLVDNCVAGHMVAWNAVRGRQVGYWLDRAYWGRGIGTQALQLFLAQESVRPLEAVVSKQNTASLRLLKKCGFVAQPTGPGETQIFVLQ